LEDRVLRIVIEHKKEEETGDWIELHSEELHNLYLQKHEMGMIWSIMTELISTYKF
jgi:hypothetical protein